MTLLGAMRTYLVAQNLVRIPRNAGATAPLWLQPRLGVPAPGDGTGVEIGATMVLGAFHSGGVPSQPYVSTWRRDTVDVRFRSTTAPAAELLAKQIRAALIDKRAWTMGAMTVIESGEWRAFDLLSSDEFGFEFVWAAWFETYAADAA